MDAAHKTATFLVIVLGNIHVASAPFLFDEFTVRVMWFVAQGLMGMFLGFLNIVMWRIQWRDLSVLCHTSNVLGFAFIVFYSRVDPTPQSFLGILLFLVLTVSAFLASARAGEARNTPSVR